MKKQIGKNLMQKWKNKIRVRLSALDKKKLVLTNIPYILTAFYTNRASFLYRNSLGEDIGNKLLYAMEHADRILTGLQPSFNWRDMLTGIVNCLNDSQSGGTRAPHTKRIETYAFHVGFISQL